MIILNTIFPFYITDITIFEKRQKQHAPTFVNGRNFCSLTYRHRGKVSIKSGETEFISSADTITFVPKGVAYTTEIFEDVHITAIHFDFIGAELPNIPTVIPVNNPKVRSIFSSLSKSTYDGSSHFTKMALLYELFDKINGTNYSLDNNLVSEKIIRAKHIIESDYSYSLFSIESLAERIKISTTYLRREFNRAYGISPLAYLKDIRIKHATHLLLTHNLSVTKIAEMCGYSSTSYFIQDFHNALGESPNQYRNRLRTTP